MCAALKENVAAIKSLLDAGADRFAVNNVCFIEYLVFIVTVLYVTIVLFHCNSQEGKTAMDLAKSDRIKNLLLSFMATSEVISAYQWSADRVQEWLRQNNFTKESQDSLENCNGRTLLEIPTSNSKKYHNAIESEEQHRLYGLIEQLKKPKPMRKSGILQAFQIHPAVRSKQLLKIVLLH